MALCEIHSKVTLSQTSLNINGRRALYTMKRHGARRQPGIDRIPGWNLSCVLLTALVFVMFSPSDSSAADVSGDAAAGERLNRDFVSVLRQSLKGREVSSSINYCDIAAGKVASNSGREGVRHIVRMTLEQAREGAIPREIPVLDEYSRIFSARSSAASESVRHEFLGPGKERWYVPITVSDRICLGCHGKIGEEVTPATVSALAIRYPEGYSLTGRKLGDPLGLWLVTVREQLRPPQR